MGNRPTGGMWARSMRTTRQVWTYARRFRRSICTIPRGRSVAARPHCRRQSLPMTKDEQGIASQSLVSEGCIINGATIIDSVLAPDVFVHGHAHVEQSVIMNGCRISRHARVRRAILDKNVVVPEGEYIGWDLGRDRQRFTLSEDGIVVVPKGYTFV